MAYEIVQCEIHYVAGYYVSGDESLGVAHSLGHFETKGDAARAFAEAGFTLRENDSWDAPYSRGYISRVIVEIK
jgi:hypothetical protein